MTNHVESYRYEIQYSDDADFVAYQRKSSNSTWRTISRWMIPQAADHTEFSPSCTSAITAFGCGGVGSFHHPFGIHCA
jgi:hypothetical protein